MSNSIFRNDLFYFSFDDLSFVMRHSVSLKCGDISGDILYRAVQKAATRYPYLCIKIERHGEQYEIVSNEEPVPVIEGSTPIVLGSSESRGHLMSVSYLHNTIYFDISHNLVDSKGLMEWIKTVVYLYLTETVDEPLSSENIRIPGEDFLPGETDDPFANMQLDGAAPLLPNDMPQTSFIPDRRYAESSKRSNYVFTASETDLMKLAGSQDGSPVSVLAFFAKEMIRELFPESRGIPILCGIPHSIRHLAAGEHNYHAQTVELNVLFDDRMDALPMDIQLTCVRGCIILRSDPDNVRYMVRRHCEFADSLDDLPTIDERRQLYHDNMRVIIEHPETVAVSYIGRMKWGSIEPYIDGITTESAAISAPVMFAFTTLNGKFYITLVLNQTSDIFVRTLVRILNDHGIASEYLYSYPQELCTIQMP